MKHQTIIKTRAQMIADLEKRIAEQREKGGDMLTYGFPDPLDVAMLGYLKHARP